MAWDSTKVEGDTLPPAEWNALVLYLKGKGNKVVSQTSAPSSAVDGEYWFDTTTGANKLKLRVAGAWVDLTLTGPAGPKGDTGAAGAKGDPGSTGATGAAGAKGDTGAAGTNGTDGTDGADGNTIIPGTIPPTSGVGIDGNFYLDFSAHVYYGPKASGTWPAGTSMIGPQGPAGTGGDGAGDVVGPASATDNAISRFDTTTGKLLQDSLVTVDDAGSVNIPTGQAYKINGSALAATDVGAAASNDARLTDARTPTAHKATHATAGTDALSASDIGAAAASHNHDSAYLAAMGTAADSSKLGGALPAAYVLTSAIGTAADKNVPATGDASATEVVLGADTRLTNARAPTAHNHDAAYAPIAKGVTNGDSHDHNGGDGGQIAYANISGTPTSLTPTAHAASHATGQADALTPANIGAEPAITTLPISKGGTGISTAPTAGKLLIGKTDGTYASANLTAGTNITVTNADGAITITSAAGAGVSRLAAIASTISILTSDAGTGKSGTIDLTATTGQIARIRLRSDFLAGQQATPGTFQVNNAAGITAAATTIAYDSGSAGMILATGGGDIIQIDGERILTATGTTTTSIAVATRGYNGTVATYHDDNAVGFKCSDGLRLELYPNSSYLPTERLLTLRGLMTGQWVIGAAGVAEGASFIPLTASPAVLSDFGAGSLIAILDTATDYARVQDIYGLVADSGTVNSIRTQTVRPAHAASTVVQRVLEYDLPVPFAFASGTSLYYKLFVDEKYTATVAVNVELIIDKYT